MYDPIIQFDESHLSIKAKVVHEKRFEKAIFCALIGGIIFAFIMFIFVPDIGLFWKIFLIICFTGILLGIMSAVFDADISTALICPSCGKIAKAPTDEGTHELRCSQCNKSWTIKVWHEIIE